MIETEDEETYDAEFVFELYDEDEENWLGVLSSPPRLKT